jgi:hypothetical protein
VSANASGANAVKSVTDITHLKAEMQIGNVEIALNGAKRKAVMPMNELGSNI